MTLVRRLLVLSKPKLRELPEDITLLIGDYVDGPSRIDLEHFRKTMLAFTKQHKMYPAKYPPIYRGVKVDDTKLEDLLDGKPLALKPRKFESWTKDEATAERFIIHRKKHLTVGVMLRESNLQPTKVIADIAYMMDLYPDLYEEVVEIARDEREVITKQVCRVCSKRNIHKLYLLPQHDDQWSYMGQQLDKRGIAYNSGAGALELTRRGRTWKTKPFRYDPKDIGYG